MSGELVLVTGGTGFVGAHCIVQLLDAERATNLRHRRAVDSRPRRYDDVDDG